MAGKAGKQSKTAWLDKHQLSDQRRAFVLAYLECLSATEAARQAGYKQAHMQGPRLMQNDGVRRAIEEGRNQIEEAIQASATDVADKWWKIASADAAEISRLHKGACRFCHGHKHQYQWRTEREFEDALCKAANALSGGNADMFDSIMAGSIVHPSIPKFDGGAGYRAKAAPNPDCPECEGDGIEAAWFADTRHLSDEAAILFDGVKVTRNGIEIATLDRLRAMENLAKHLGMFTAKVDAEETSPLQRFVQALMAGAETVPVSQASQGGSKSTPTDAHASPTKPPEEETDGTY